MKKSNVAIITSQIWQVVEMIIGCCLAGFFGLVAILSIGEETFTTAPKVFCAVCIAVGVLFISDGVKRKKIIKKFKEYVQIIAGDPYNSLETIAEATNTSYDVVKKNVMQMIKKRYFSNATVDEQSRSLILKGKDDTNQIIKDKESTQVVNPFTPKTISMPGPTTSEAEMLSIKCKGCGAVNIVGRGRVVECEYCGNMLKGE